MVIHPCLWTAEPFNDAPLIPNHDTITCHQRTAFNHGMFQTGVSGAAHNCPRLWLSPTVLLPSISENEYIYKNWSCIWGETLNNCLCSFFSAKRDQQIITFCFNYVSVMLFGLWLCAKDACGRRLPSEIEVYLSCNYHVMLEALWGCTHCECQHANMLTIKMLQFWIVSFNLGSGFMAVCPLVVRTFF